jgi:RNA polymerase sigma-70 factor (ECF subfamily)
VAELPSNQSLVSDEDLVTRVVGGETTAFEIIVQRYSRRLYRVALSVLRNEAEAEDVVQDTFLSAYQHLGQFAGRARFSTWISRIALHRAFAVASQMKRRVSLDEEYDGEQPMRIVPDHSPSPEQRRYFDEVAMLMSLAIADLPESYRSVLMLREVDQVDTSATARRLRISQANVKVRLHRARAMLRAHYEQALAAGIAPAAHADPSLVALAS